MGVLDGDVNSSRVYFDRIQWSRRILEGSFALV